MSEPQPNFIEIDQVFKRFEEDRFVLEDISINLKRGDFLALIGPSGCGKSTLLKLISNLISATSGSIRIGGGDVQDVSEKLGYVFQDANLLPWLSIRDNAALPLKLAGVNREEQHTLALSMLEMVGLGEAADRYPRELSGGMKMRASIARALATQPEILLLDEPFGALDEMTRDDLNEELLSLREQQGWTGIFVTHSVTEAVFLSSKVMVMSANPGRIHELIDVDLGYPRSAETRTTEAFQKKLAEVTKSLHSVRQPKADSKETETTLGEETI